MDKEPKNPKTEQKNSIPHTEAQGSLNESVYKTTSKLSSDKVEDSRLKKLWKDPVISKLIATGIIFLLPLLSAIVIKLIKNEPFWNSVKEVFNYELKIWISLLILISAIGLLFLAKWAKRKYFKTTYYFPFDEQIGNFRWFEMYNILLDTKHKLPQSFALQSGVSDANLLMLFMFYAPLLNMGVDWDHPGGEQGTFLFYKLGPVLISYGLCEKVKSLNKIGDTELWAIQTSEIGMKFFAWTEKYKAFEDYVSNKNKK